MPISNVGAFDIILSTRRDVLEEFAATGEISSENEKFVFTPKNTNFLSLEHDVLDDDSFLVTIKIQDVGAAILHSLSYTDTNDFLEKELSEQGKSSKQYFLMYGIGGNKVDHWAGPFSMDIYNIDYIVEDNGLEVIILTFVPQLYLYAELTLSEKNTAIVESYLSKQNISLEVTDTATLLGDVVVVKKDTYRIATINFSSSKIIETIKQTYSNYAKQFGIENFYIPLPKEIQDFIDSTIVTIRKNNRISRFDAITISSAIVSLGNKLNNLGLSLVGKTVDADNPEEIKVEYYIDIASPYKKTINFLEPFRVLLNFLGKSKKTVTNLRVLQENNTEIVKFIHTHALNGKEIIQNPERPLTIVGDSSMIKNQVYAFNSTAPLLDVHEITKLGNGYRSNINKYYIDKIAKRSTKNYWESAHTTESFALPSKTTAVEPETIKFNANTPNSNILAFNFDTNYVVLAAFRKKLGSIALKDKAKVEELVEKIIDKLVKSNNHKYDITNYDIDKFKENIYKYLIQTSKSGAVAISAYTPDDVEAAIASYIKLLWNIAVTGGITGTIKTLPMYNLSDRFILGSKCEVDILKNPAVLTVPNSDLDIDSIYTGTYIILGFKHTITPTDSYSEFSIVKEGLPPKQNKSTVKGYNLNNANVI